MFVLNQIFTFYDRLIMDLPAKIQILISLLVLALLIWSLFSIMKKGHWIFVIIFVILFPSGFGAMKNIALIVWGIVKFLLTRIQVNL